MNGKMNLQDVLLNRVRREGVFVTIFLVSGYQIRGRVTGFDSFTVVCETDGRQQMIYKHAISTIIPVRNIDLYAGSEE